MNRMSTVLTITTLGVTALVFTNAASAAIVTDPAIASGAGDVIDPTGDAQDVDQSFGTAQATLEARSNLRVLQTFTGFANYGTIATGNIVSFTDSTLPDIQLAFSGSPGTSASGVGNAAGSQTSSGSQLNQVNSGSGTSSTLTITFGTWDGSTFSANETVEAAAFTISNVYTNKSGTAMFRDSSGTLIAGATFDYTGASNFEGTGNHKDFYFGWDATAQSSVAIGSVTVTFVDAPPTGGSAFFSGIDDIAFTTVPEPASLGLLGLGALLIARRRGA